MIWLIKIEQKKYIFRLKILFYIRNVKFSLKTIKDGWGRLRTVEDGWGRLGTVGDGGRWGDGRGTGTVTVGDGDGDGRDGDAARIGTFTEL